MTRKLESQGLVLVVILAIVALSISAAPASAEQFHSEASTTTLSGAQETRNTFSVNAGTVHCLWVEFSGLTFASTTQQFTVEPRYAACKITTVTLETLEATVDLNGCHYLVTPDGEVHLTCPSTDVPSPPPPHGIRITAPLCTITVKPQTIQEIDYGNVGEGQTRSVTVTSTATSIAYQQSAFCPGGGGGSFTNGTYAGSASTTCVDVLQNHAGCWWTRTL